MKDVLYLISDGKNVCPNISHRLMDRIPPSTIPMTQKAVTHCAVSAAVMRAGSDVSLHSI